MHLAYASRRELGNRSLRNLTTVCKTWRHILFRQMLQHTPIKCESRIELRDLASTPFLFPHLQILHFVLNLGARQLQVNGAAEIVADHPLTYSR